MMNRKHKTMLIGYVVVAVILYLLGSFAECSFNISLWNETIRYTCAVVWGVLVGIISLVVLEN